MDGEPCRKKRAWRLLLNKAKKEVAETGVEEGDSTEDSGKKGLKPKALEIQTVS